MIGIAECINKKEMKLRKKSFPRHARFLALHFEEVRKVLLNSEVCSFILLKNYLFIPTKSDFLS